MKINFHCNTCLGSFLVEGKYLIKKTSVTCPNCDTNLPEESFEQLKQGVELIIGSRSHMETQKTNAGFTQVFEFTFTN